MTGSADRFGLSVALATPFHTDGSVDHKRLTAHAEHCLEGGCSSVTAFGTTGEGPSLSVAERSAVLETLDAAGISGDRLVVCVTASAIGDAVEQAHEALGRNPRGVLLAPPFYFKDVGDDGIFAWYRSVLDGLGDAARNVILYNIPPLTRVALSIDLISRLRDAFGEAIIGVKDSSCDWSVTEPLLRAHGDIAILVGDESDLAAAVRLGATGTICGLANLFPHAVARIVEGHDDPFIVDVVRLIGELPVVPAIKALIAAETGDPLWRMVRAPLVPLDAEEEAVLVTGFRTLTSGRSA